MPTLIAPAEPPFAPEAEQLLGRMMPPGTPPIGLFRTFVRNLPMAEAMTGWGRYELGRDLSLDRRQREIVIDRTCARCGCEYEWGVHVAFFAGRVGLDAAQVASLTHGAPTDPCWEDEHDRVLIEVADQLHERATLDEALATRLAACFDERQILDLLLLCGWYHAISYAANGAGVALEPWAPRFEDHRPAS